VLLGCNGNVKVACNTLGISKQKYDPNVNKHVKIRRIKRKGPLLAWKQPSFRPGKIGSISAMFFAKAARDF